MSEVPLDPQPFWFGAFLPVCAATPSMAARTWNFVGIWALRAPKGARVCDSFQQILTKARNSVTHGAYGVQTLDF